MSVTGYRRFHVGLIGVGVSRRGEGSRAVRRGVEQLAVGTEAPVRDLGFVDHVAGIVGGRQARSRTDCAVHVDHLLTRSADEMVMVIVHSIFVASRGSDGLNSSKKTIVDQHAKGVVHRLARNGPDVGLCDFSDFVSGHVRLTCNRAKHRNALSRRLDTAFAKLINGADAH